MEHSRLRRLRREFRAELRDSRLLFRRFRIPLAAFILIILGCGTLYYYLAQNTGDVLGSWAEAVYLVLSLTFLQPNGNFPEAGILQAFYFIMPVLGIGALAQGLADFGVLLFNRHARGKEWEMAVASTLSNHVVLVGLGHLGFRVVRKLHEMDQDVVVIDLQTQDDLLQNVRGMGIPVINDDASRESILEGANVRRAKAIILCTQNDNLNLQVALKARNLNPNIQVVIRIFDDDFAQSLQKQFGFTALSATGMAAPVFAASAANIDITPPINIEGQPNSLARIQIARRSKLSDFTIDQIEDQFHVSIVMLTHEGKQKLHPAGDSKICEEDTLAVLGHPNQITLLVNQNRK